MSVPVGGLAAKFGPLYEKWWVLHCALLLMRGDVVGLRWDSSEKRTQGVDVQLTYPDGHVEYQQLKRQNGALGRWTIAELHAEGVLTHARALLSADATARFAFVSSDPVRHLKDLADRALLASDDPQAFLQDHVCSHRDREKAFRQLLENWELEYENPDHVRRVIALLKRIECRVVERGEPFRRELEWRAGLHFDGEPSAIVAHLGQFVEDRVGREIRGTELIAYLKQKGLGPHDLRTAPGLAASIAKVTAELVSELRDRLIGGKLLERPEVDGIIKALQAESPPGLVVLHGRAGAGKSAAMYRIIDGLDVANIPTLAISMTAPTPSGTPRHYGTKQLGLPGSPAKALAAVAAGTRAVLVIDQLDALRMTSKGSLDAWKTCKQVIEEALLSDNLSVVLACRTFDLEHDPSISRWHTATAARPALRIEKLDLGELPEATVAGVVKGAGVVFGKLNPRVRRLLRHPFTLSVWHTLAAKGHVHRDFATTTALMQDALSLWRAEAVHIHGVSEADVAQVLEALVRRMEVSGQLVAPQAAVADRNVTVDALCSIGVLVKTKSSLRFVHQAVFDYLTAERAMRSAGTTPKELLQWFSRDQSLYRRDQMRHLLFLLQDSGEGTYSSLLRAVIENAGMRFHIKRLALDVLAESIAPSDAEVALVRDLAKHDGLWEHLTLNTLWGRTAWFDALVARGVLQDWLSTSNQERYKRTLRLLSSVVASRGNVIDTLMETSGYEEAARAESVGYIMPWRAEEDSPRMFEIRVRRVAHGSWPMDDLHLLGVAQHRPDRVVPLLAAMIRAALRRRDARAVSHLTRDVDHAIDTHILGAVRAHARAGWIALRPLLGHAIRRHARADASDTFTARVEYLELVRLLERLVSQCVSGLAATDPSAIISVLERSNARRPLDSVDRALAAGLVDAPSELSSRVLQWLCERTERFVLGDGHDILRQAPARSLIQSHSGQCDDATFQRLECAILSYRDAREKRSCQRQCELVRCGRYDYRSELGLTQLLLLDGLSPDRISIAARVRLAAWRAKHGDARDVVPLSKMSGRGGMVKSPIPSAKLQKVSDAGWLRIVRGDWKTRDRGEWRQLDKDNVAERSDEHFASDFGVAARREPNRFAGLALQLPPETPPVYWERLLDAFASIDTSTGEADGMTATPEQLAQVVFRVPLPWRTETVRAFCRMLERRAADLWPTEVVERLLVSAVHEDPVSERGAVSKGVPRALREPAIGSIGINSARGCVVGALRALLFHHMALWSRCERVIRALLEDPHPAVRHESIGLCLPIWNVDRELSLTLFIDACGHPDDRVLASPWVGEFLRYGLIPFNERLYPLIQRLVNCSDDRVAETGAAWATVANLRLGGLAGAVAQCRNGTEAQRRGLASAAIELLGSELEDGECEPLESGSGDESKIAAECTGLLLQLFEDADHEVRGKAASVFRLKGIMNAECGRRLARGYVPTSAFDDDPDELLRPLADDAENVVAYSDVVLAAARRLTDDLAEEARSIQERLGMVGETMAKLLLRLYDSARGLEDRSMCEECLDRWDAMLEARIGRADRHLDALDREGITVV